MAIILYVHPISMGLGNFFFKKYTNVYSKHYIFLIKKNQGGIDRRLLISRGRTGGRLRPQTGPGPVGESVRRFQTTLPLSLVVIVLKVNTNVPS